MKKDQLQQLLRTIPHPDTPEGVSRIRELLIANGIDPATFHQSAEMSSRYVDAHTDVSFPGDTVPPHSHNFYELVYCLTGGVEYMLGDNLVQLHRGDILCIPIGLTHAPLVPEQMPEPYRRYVLWISQEFYAMISSMFLLDMPADTSLPQVIRTGYTDWEHLGQYFRRCVQECEQQRYRYDAVVFGITSELAVQLARFLLSQRAEQTDKPVLLDQIIHYVEAHLSERITVADIAARFWVSPSSFSQLFKKKMGISFYRYVTQRRLLESKLLIKSGMPMEQVSISVGFQDYSSFYRAFKAEFGQSPAQFRKEQ